MKHSIEDLMFAAMIRRRVVEIRDAKCHGMTEADAAAYRAQPADAVIAEALEEMERIATVLKKLRAERQHAHPAPGD